jgi:hypothetical protein
VVIPAFAIGALAVGITLAVDWSGRRSGRESPRNSLEANPARPGLDVEAQDGSGRWYPIARNVDLTVGAGEAMALIRKRAPENPPSRWRSWVVRDLVPASLVAARLGKIEVLSLPVADRRSLRGSRIGYVSQSAASGLNPASGRRSRSLR